MTPHCRSSQSLCTLQKQYGLHQVGHLELKLKIWDMCPHICRVWWTGLTGMLWRSCCWWIAWTCHAESLPVLYRVGHLELRLWLVCVQILQGVVEGLDGRAVDVVLLVDRLDLYRIDAVDEQVCAWPAFTSAGCARLRVQHRH